MCIGQDSQLGTYTQCLYDSMLQHIEQGINTEDLFTYTYKHTGLYINT